MKIKNDRKPLILVAICLLIVIALVLLNIIESNQKTDYSDLTDEEIAVVVQNEIDEMETNSLASMGERDRIEYYVSSFVDALEKEDYETAYSMLYDDFKKNYFSSLDAFKEYAQTKFPDMFSLEHTNFERNGDYYILWVTMSSPLGGKNSSSEMNFIVRENDLNDFDLSFSVI